MFDVDDFCNSIIERKEEKYIPPSRQISPRGGVLIDLLGQRFGKLVVIERAESDPKNNAMWKCKCDCGNIRIVRSYHLRKGETSSCGKCNYEDFSGQKINSLFVEEFVGKVNGHAMWKCLCDCGNTTIVQGSHLQAGDIKSCGCLRTLNLNGQRFGRLLVLRKAKYKQKKSVGIHWLCKCDCGNFAIISTHSLYNGYTRSCGCYRTDRLKEVHTTHGMSRTREYAHQCHVKRRELKAIYDSSWTVEMEVELRKLFLKCVVCGMTDLEHFEKYGHSLTVDHVLPLISGNGLSPENATILCISCNSIKNDRSLEQLPDEMRLSILKAVKKFKAHWDSISIKE